MVFFTRLFPVCSCSTALTCFLFAHCSLCFFARRALACLFHLYRCVFSSFFGYPRTPAAHTRAVDPCARAVPAVHAAPSLIAINIFLRGGSYRDRPDLPLNVTTVPAVASFTVASRHTPATARRQERRVGHSVGLGATAAPFSPPSTPSLPPIPIPACREGHCASVASLLQPAALDRSALLDGSPALPRGLSTTNPPDAARFPPCTYSRPTWGVTSGAHRCAAVDQDHKGRRLLTSGTYVSPFQPPSSVRDQHSQCDGWRVRRPPGQVAVARRGPSRAHGRAPECLGHTCRPCCVGHPPLLCISFAMRPTLPPGRTGHHSPRAGCASSVAHSSGGWPSGHCEDGARHI